jgi:pyruvate dehydrogenase E1 component
VIPVDFSTGSVGLGVAVTAFASLVQDWLIAHGQLAADEAGRMIALMGDAELDEGNIYECLIEATSTTSATAGGSSTTTARASTHHGRPHVPPLRRHLRDLRLAGDHAEARQAAARGLCKRPGGRRWKTGSRPAPMPIMPRSPIRAARRGGRGWNADLRAMPRRSKLLASHDDEALARLMTDLGGHCIETLLEAFDAAQDDGPPCSSPIRSRAGPAVRRPQGQPRRPDEPHPDRGAARQPRHRARRGMGALGGPGRQSGRRAEGVRRTARFARKAPRHRAFDAVPVPAIPVPEGAEQSTQAAFGRILFDLAKSGARWPTASSPPRPTSPSPPTSARS